MIYSFFRVVQGFRLGIALAALVLCTTPAALANSGNVVVNYRMSLAGLHVADVVDTLEFANGRYQITSTATAVGIAAVLNLDKIDRFSEGVYGADGSLLCERYEHVQGDRHREVKVDLEAGEVFLGGVRLGVEYEGEGNVQIGGEKPDFEGEGEGLIYDHLTSLYSVYTKGVIDPAGKILITDGRKLKEYEYTSDLQPAPVQTELGEVNAVLLERKTASDREYQAWYAPEMNLIPVRVRIRDGSVVIEFEITSVQFEEGGGV